MGDSLTNTLAKGVQAESHPLKDLNKAEELKETQTDHTECIEKANELEKRIVDLEKRS